MGMMKNYYLSKIEEKFSFIIFLILISLFNILNFWIPGAQASASSWPMYMHDPQRSGKSNFLGPQTDKIAWIFKGIATHYGWGASQPVVGSDETIYVYSEVDNYLYAIDSVGNLKWKVRTAEENVGGGAAFAPAVDNNMKTIYIPGLREDLRYNLLAIDLSDGSIKWSYPIGFLASSPAIGPDGTIYVGAGSLYAINSDGTLKWRCDEVSTGDPFPIAISSDGTIYVPESDGLVAIDSDGNLKWKIHTGWINIGPVIGADSTIYLPIYLGGILAISNNGEIKWSSLSCSNNSTTPLAVDSDRKTIYFGAGSSLCALNFDGNLKWKLSFDNCGFGYNDTPVIDSAGDIYIGCGTSVYALYPNGTLKWKYTDYESVGLNWTSLGSKRTLYVMSGFGKLYAFGSLCGELKGDFDGDCDVDLNDLNILLSYRNQPSSACPCCDLDGDGMITVLDARKLVLLCTRPKCATQ